MIDILSPEVSSVTKGLSGKSILIYGANRTGKTFNTAGAKGAVVFAFENGLNAIPGVKFFRMKKWSDWQDVIKSLSQRAKAEEFKKKVGDILVVDTAEAMFDLGERYVCATFGVISVDRDSSGKKGYGIWKEFREEIKYSINSLTNCGFTVVFLAHDDVRTFETENGTEYTQIYPRGDRRSIDYLCDICDIIAYAHAEGNTQDGIEKNSTLFLRETPFFKAGSRFEFMPASIPEWNMEKLENAIVEAINKKEKESGITSITFEEEQNKKIEQENQEKKNWKPLGELVDSIGKKVAAMVKKNGNKDEYENILQDVLHNKEFRAQEAGENQREQLEQVLRALTEAGY